MPSAPRHRCTGSPTCPVLLPAGVRYCPAHAAEYEQRRGTRQQRGYDAGHDRLRAEYELRLSLDAVLHCTRCGAEIRDGDAWDLGHDDARRHRGPECVRCNRGAGGRRGARRRR